MRRVIRNWLLAALAALIVAGPAWAGAQEGAKAGGLTKDQKEQLNETLRDVINEGAKIFNEQRDYAGCYRLYEGALLTVRPLLGNHPDLQKSIDTSLGEASAHPSVVQRAFILRKALGQVREQLGNGDPATPVQPPPPTPADPKDKDFKINVPASLKIKQGEKKEVKIGIAPGKAFQGKITVEFKPSKGLAVAPKKKELSEKDKELSAAITAAKDAPPGKGEVKVTATGGGKTHERTIAVEIEKAEKAPPPPPPPPPQTGKVSGKVSLDGKALPSGKVQFFAKEKKQAEANIADGSYTVAKELAPGKYTVVLTAAPAKPDQPKVAVPEKFTAPKTSPLMVNVKAGPNTFDFNLKSEKQPPKNNDPKLPPPKDPKPGDAKKVGISGTVTFKGQPLPEGQVHLFSKDGKKYADANIKDGKFSAKNVAPGQYRIAITATTTDPAQPKVTIPEKYQFFSTSKLTIEVTAKGPQQFNFELK